MIHISSLRNLASLILEMFIFILILFNTCNFCYSNLLLSNSTFLLVKACFTKPAVTLQSSIKDGTVGRFGKKDVCK